MAQRTLSNYERGNGMIAQFFIVMLMLDAAVVFVGQVKKYNVWALVCLYWALLTVKNLCDLMGW